MRPPQIREQGGALIVTLDDPAAVNDAMASELRQPLYQAVLDRPGARVVVDLGPIDYLSSSGVALLVGIRRRTDQVAGQLVLCRVRPEVHDLLRSMRLASLFRFAADEAEALEVLSSAPDV